MNPNMSEFKNKNLEKAYSAQAAIITTKSSEQAELSSR